MKWWYILCSPVSVPHSTGTAGAPDTVNISVLQVDAKENSLPAPMATPPVCLDTDIVLVEGPVRTNSLKSKRIYMKYGKNYLQDWSRLSLE